MLTMETLLGFLMIFLWITYQRSPEKDLTILEKNLYTLSVPRVRSRVRLNMSTRGENGSHMILMK